jgi:hypothetical protein
VIIIFGDQKRFAFLLKTMLLPTFCMNYLAWGALRKRTFLYQTFYKHNIVPCVLVWARVARWFLFKPKIPILVHFGRPLEWKLLVYFMPNWNITAIWYILWSFGDFVGIWNIFPRFGTLWQEKSGNPGLSFYNGKRRKRVERVVSATRAPILRNAIFPILQICVNFLTSL